MPKKISAQKASTALAWFAFVFMFSTYTDSFAGMSSVDVRTSTSYNFKNKKYEYKEETLVSGSLKKTHKETEEATRKNELTLATHFHYIYSYNEGNYFQLFAVPAVHYDFAKDEETSVDLGDVKISFFNDLTGKWSVFGGSTSSSTDNAGEKETIVSGQETQSKKNDTSLAPKLAEETSLMRYYRNRTNVDTRYIYGSQNFIQLGTSYDLLRQDSDAVDNKNGDYDRYSVRLSNEYRFSSKWGTTLQTEYVRGKYQNKTELRTPVESFPKSLEETTTATAPTNEAKDASYEEVEISGDVSEYRFSGSIINFLNPSNRFILSYNYIGAFYDARELNDNTTHSGRLSWYHRFSSILEGTFGLGPSWQNTDGRDDNFGINGSVKLHYLQKRGSYSFQVEKIYDVENFDGTDERGAVDKLRCHFTTERELCRKLKLRGKLSYIDERGDKKTAVQRNVDGELQTIIEGFEKQTWKAGLGFYYQLSQEFRAGVDYTFTHLDTDKEKDSYDEHQVLFNLDWDKEWLRW